MNSTVCGTTYIHVNSNMEFISSALSSLHVLSMFASHDKDLNGFLHVHQWMSSISVISLQYPFASTLRRSLNPELSRFISNRCKTCTYNNSFWCNITVLSSFLICLLTFSWNNSEKLYQIKIVTIQNEIPLANIVHVNLQHPLLKLKKVFVL